MTAHCTRIFLTTAIAFVWLWQAKSDEPAKDSPRAALKSFQGTKAGDLRDDNGLKMKFVWCPPGEFTMGTPNSAKIRPRNESHVEVTLTSGFWMGRTEVTQEQWEKATGTTPWKSSKGFARGRFAGGKIVVDGPVTNLAPDVIEGADIPAVCVSWNDTLVFCR